MVERIRFRKWEFECDPEATRMAYEGVLVGAESCTERVCQNFAAARDHVYPREALDLFRRLGIDSRREAETYHVCRLGPKTLRYWRDAGQRISDDVLSLHLHGGWFHFVGSIVAGPESHERLSGPPKPGTRLVGEVVLDAETHKAIPGAGGHWTVHMEPVSDRFSVGFTTHTALVPESFRGHPVVQMEFEAYVPWVLSEQDPCQPDE